MTTLVQRSGWLRILISITVASALVAGCAGSAALAPSVGEGGGQGAPSAAPAPPVDEGVGRSDDQPPLSAPLREDLKVVYTGSLELVVDDLAGALARARSAVLAVGGYVGASSERNDDQYSVATITYRIPAERWDETVDTLRGIASRVVGGETQATEVGSQIVDLEARLRNLRASEAVLVEIASGTGKVSDLLEVQARITEVRGEIERIDAQRAQLEDQVAYGTLVTTFGTEIAQVQQTAKDWDPAKDVDGATAALIEAGQVIVSGAIWFGIVWLPVILVLVALALLVRWTYRRIAPRFQRARPTAPAGPVQGWGGGEG
ncbi:MAG: DUF4349 domain-containing protein [Candidatus Limnocylindria bacterium]